MKTYYTETIRKCGNGYIATAWLALGVEPFCAQTDVDPEVASWLLSERVKKTRGEDYAPAWEKQMLAAIEAARRAFPACAFSYSRWNDDTGVPTIEIACETAAVFVLRFVDATPIGVSWRYEIHAGGGGPNEIQHAAPFNATLAVFLAAGLAMYRGQE